MTYVMSVINSIRDNIREWGSDKVSNFFWEVRWRGNNDWPSCHLLTFLTFQYQNHLEVFPQQVWDLTVFQQQAVLQVMFIYTYKSPMVSAKPVVSTTPWTSSIHTTVNKYASHGKSQITFT